MNPDPRRGFRLIDLMGIVLVTGLVLALIVRVLNPPTDGGRRLQCQNNMRQVGLGLLGYSIAKNRFPNAGTFFDDPAAHRGDPSRSNLALALANPAALGGSVEDPRRDNWVVEILPYIDIPELYNAWNQERGYLSNTAAAPGQPSNFQIANTAIFILRCPDDNTTAPNQGHLSYVVNGGFTRWPALPFSWTGSATDGLSGNGGRLGWTSPGQTWQEGQAIGKRLGVMFLGTQTGDQPWDIATRPADLSDGAASTLLAGENTLVGISSGSPYSGGVPTNWACPLPNFTMFLGSDDVCRSQRSDTDCLGGQLRPRRNGRDGEGWAQANRPGTFENINFGQSLTVEGSFPFANSGHPGGANFGFCDGSVRFLSDTIDGTVYARLLTPSGGQLPEGLSQFPLSRK